MISRRILQINELIRKHLGDIIAREVDFKPGLIVTIAKVDTTPDLRHTRVGISVLPETEREYAMKTLRHEAWKIESGLHGLLYMKPLPKLSFRFDETESKADEVEHLLKRIEEEENS
jgi:ribosome-binding factor A